MRMWVVKPLILLGILAFFTPAVMAGTVVGYSEDEAYRLGEQMFRAGIRPDGTPIKAVAGRGIPMDGTQVTCVNCHQRSGIGSVEGDVIAWPINGDELYTPRRRTGAWSPKAESRMNLRSERTSLPPAFQVKYARPAYNDDSLAYLLRTGIDPAGRSLGDAMPKFQLDDTEMALLIHYLKNLSPKGEYSPGVDEQTIHFATVIAGDVPENDKTSMLEVLKAHIRARNTQTRPHLRRKTNGPFYKTESFNSYRKLDLAVWTLEGEPETWREQLESYYRANPVFAILGGLSNGSWEPIHQFSEQNQIPTILPITDQPVLSEKDWYTLYFSKGLYQEGYSTARYLAHNLKNVGTGKRLIQVVDATQKSRLLANGFNQGIAGNGAAVVIDMSIPEASLQQQISELITDDSTLLLWVAPEKGRVLLEQLNKQKSVPEAIYVSEMQYSGNYQSLPKSALDHLFIAYSKSLPGEADRKEFAIKNWLKRQGIALKNFDIQTKMYFLGWLLPGAISHMRSEFYRDYFMEGFDMMPDQNYAISVYPRVSFASGQRYLSKGCYILKYHQGKDAKPEKVAGWIIH